MINFVLRIPKFPGSISSLNRNTLLKQKLKQWWQWCLVKIEFIFYLQILQLSRSVQCTYGFKNYLRLKCVQCYYNNYSKQKIQPPSLACLFWLHSIQSFCIHLFFFCRRWQWNVLVLRFIQQMYHRCFGHLTFCLVIISVLLSLWFAWAP